MTFKQETSMRSANMSQKQHQHCGRYTVANNAVRERPEKYWRQPERDKLCLQVRNSPEAK